MKQVTALIYPTSIHYKVTLRRALRICQFFGANLHIVAIIPKAEDEAHLDRNMKLLRDTCSGSIGKQHGEITITYEVTAGSVIPIISDIVISNSSDLLVIGTSGNNLLHRLLFGNKEVDIAHKVPCPVFLVPPNDTERTIKRIVYTTNFAFNDIAALSVIEDWVSIFKAEVLCLHICEEFSDIAESKQKLESIKSRFDNLRFHYKIIQGDVVNQINRQIEFGETDLVVALHERKSWWAKALKPSITEEISAHATIPMLIFK